MGNQHNHHVVQDAHSSLAGGVCKSPSLASLNESPVEKLAKFLMHQSSKEEHSEGISLNSFQKYVCKNNNILGEYFYNYIRQKTTHKEKCYLTKGDFKEVAHHVLSLTDDDHVEFYVKVFSKGGDNMSKENMSKLVETAYKVALWARRDTDTKDPAVCEALEAVTLSAMHGKNEVPTTFVVHWLEENCPRLLIWTHRYLAHQLSTAYKFLQKRPENDDEEDRSSSMPSTPVLDNKELRWSSPLNPTHVWLLSTVLPLLYSKPQEQQGGIPSVPSLSLLDPHVFIARMIQAVSPTHWAPLYNSESHGLSVNRFQHHVFSYRGPTVTFLKGEGNQLFCLAIDEEWHESHHFWGGSSCMAVQLLPLFRLLDRGEKLVFVNFSIRGYPFGIQVGTDPRSHILEVDQNLSLLSYKKIPYRLQSFEIWGCGSAGEREAQLEVKKWEVKQAEKHRKVNLNACDWRENPDLYLLEMAGTRQSYVHYDSSKKE